MLIASVQLGAFTDSGQYPDAYIEAAFFKDGTSARGTVQNGTMLDFRSLLRLYDAAASTNINFHYNRVLLFHIFQPGAVTATNYDIGVRSNQVNSNGYVWPSAEYANFTAIEIG